ncbi:protein of unknown function [Acetoanaerobium sticklandii]|uniref:Uncharacterized protein n=1 Tax=Acetoanaerobium sticklandii (strain ATCC 12662 / DSM 519 / JCM 1433 / CCUG 9281 / NCIMB 10654 / HF) TaxID=499177 RepID=E3PRX3_ACESD|nr:hypothetical protein [Acetoanaerobium sticklandii]CBH21627.1 protein of unknown function [Acetoanaerobium sticklandii]
MNNLDKIIKADRIKEAVEMGLSLFDPVALGVKAVNIGVKKGLDYYNVLKIHNFFKGFGDGAIDEEEIKEKIKKIDINILFNILDKQSKSDNLIINTLCGGIIYTAHFKEKREISYKELNALDLLLSFSIRDLKNFFRLVYLNNTIGQTEIIGINPKDFEGHKIYNSSVTMQKMKLYGYLEYGVFTENGIDATESCNDLIKQIRHLKVLLISYEELAEEKDIIEKLLQ